MDFFHPIINYICYVFEYAVCSEVRCKYTHATPVHLLAEGPCKRQVEHDENANSLPAAWDDKKNTYILDE